MDEKEFEEIVKKEKRKAMVWDEELGCYIYDMTPRRRQMIPFNIVMVEEQSMPFDFNGLLNQFFRDFNFPFHRKEEEEE